jgi:hypothetical protein
LYSTLSPIGGAPLELDALDALDELDELDELEALLEFDELDAALELDELPELELTETSPLLLEPTLPPVPPVGSSRELRSGSTP